MGRNVPNSTKSISIDSFIGVLKSNGWPDVVNFVWFTKYWHRNGRKI